MLSQDRVRTIGIYKAPPDVSRVVFETEFKDMVARFIELPIVQKNLLKHEVCFAREHLDDHARAVPLGVTQTNAMIVAILEAESHEAFHEISEDPAFRELMVASAQILGADLGEIFAAEVMITIDK
ncbi:hypothetical protein FB451DRAFT_1412678 [Mycena latifolia]|nr:hypothetical protein FB451DRAFT_1412678 [Mycena latifolia]